MDGRLQPGDRLVETTLAEEIGVSRTPVREAIRRLLQEKWVVLHEFGGAIVRGFSADDLKGAYTTRAVLEGLAGRLACRNASDAGIAELRGLVASEKEAQAEGRLEDLSALNATFHESVAKLCQNPSLLDALGALAIHTVYYRRAIVVASKDAAWRQRYVEYVKHRIDDHMHIVQLLESRDEDKTEARMRRHVLENADNMIDLLGLDGSNTRDRTVATSAAGTP